MHLNFALQFNRYEGNINIPLLEAIKTMIKLPLVKMHSSIKILKYIVIAQFIVISVCSFIIFGPSNRFMPTNPTKRNILVKIAESSMNKNICQKMHYKKNKSNISLPRLTQEVLSQETSESQRINSCDCRSLVRDDMSATFKVLTDWCLGNTYYLFASMHNYLY